MAPVAPGDILADKYRVERVIGTGGMGVVVAATHLTLDKIVAVKFVLPAALKDSASTERFLREARLAVRLRSEHVAKVLDVGTLKNGAPFMVMEYLEGANLAEVLQQQGPLPFESAVDLIVQACEALGEAHALGIVHRDLKSQNLFLTTGVGGGPVLKVLDFGISKMQSSPQLQNLTQSMTVLGSPLYMAPEQMKSSRDVDARADIWALGVVLYELLTARFPFDAETMAGLALQIAQDPPPPIEERRADVPAALAAVVFRCLEKDRERRFAGVVELATALEPFATEASAKSLRRTQRLGSGESRPGVITPSGPVPPATPATPAPWSGSSPVRAASSPTWAKALSIGVFLGLVSAIVIWFMQRNAPSSSPKAAASQGASMPTDEPAAPAESATVAEKTAPSSVSAVVSPETSAAAEAAPSASPSSPRSLTSPTAAPVTESSPPRHAHPIPPTKTKTPGSPGSPGSIHRSSDDDIPALR
ncbi:MAG TPA: protein kinase [Polyangiaceae bacterium]|nr:protein kinase [Polyangiaceae bacterium]